MKLDQLKKNWERFAQSDPLWAILTVPDKRGGRWDTAEFFRSGEIEISCVLQAARDNGFEVRPGAALDFGCGVGRLTQALCSHFDRSYGVDIAPTMIAEASRYNRHRERCTYVHNERSDLQVFANNFFDFIYSNIVLQHMRPEYSHAYLREFLRVLAPGGLLVFQLPDRLRTRPLPAAAASAPLPEAGFQAAISSTCTALDVVPGQSFAVSLVVRNGSGLTWPGLGRSDGSYQLFVGNHWLTADQSMLVYDDGRSALPHDVAPGLSFETLLACTAPERSGEYLLEIDMGQEKVTWFKDRGSPTLQLTVRVLGREGTATRNPSPIACVPLSHRYPRLHATARRTHLLPMWRWLKAKIVATRNGTSPRAPVMEMYGTPQQSVCDLLVRAGGRVLRVEDDNCAGPNWVGHRYWITKD